MGKEFTVSGGREQVLSFLVSCFEDIVRTNQKLVSTQAELADAKARVEQYALQLEGRVRVCEDKYSALMENASEAILVVGGDGRVQEANRKAEDVLGRPRAELSGQPLRLLLEDDGDEPQVECSSSGTLPSTSRVRRPDGRLMWIESSTSCVEAGGERIELTILRDITNRKLAEDKLRHDSVHDALTGLANRALFLHRLEVVFAHAQRDPGHVFATLFLDLDGFKAINDTLGHEAGDELLVEVARRLRSSVRPGDVVARLGGDEFAVLLDGVRGALEASGVAERIQEELSRPVSVAGQQVSTTASIGIAFNNGADAGPEDVLRNADAAMYRAKRLGKARYESFERAVRVARGEGDVSVAPLDDRASRGGPQVRPLGLFQHPVSLTTSRN